MGNTQGDSNPFYASDASKQTELGLILSEFNFVSIYQDQLFGRCSILQHKQTKQLIITKEMDCQGQADSNRLYAEFLKRKNVLTSHNLLRLRYVVKKKTSGLFSDQYKIILFFDYVMTSLRAELNNRIQNQKYFTNEELNVLASGLIQGYAALEAEKIINDKVRINNIYFGIKEGSSLPKVIDSSLFPSPTNIQAIKNGSFTDEIFLPPEQLNKQGNECSPLSGVWSLGATILELALLLPSKDLYNYSRGSINYIELENRLNVLKNKYNLSIFCMVRDMLERSSHSRPSFTKLAQQIPSTIKDLPQSISLSVVKSNKPSLISNSSSRFLSSSTRFSKVVNPLSSSAKSNTGMLVSEYRPEIDATEIYTNGNKYQGQKKDGLRHGKGKYIYSDNSYYYGDWVRGKMEGQGQLYNTEGRMIYDGHWKDDHYDGFGKLQGLGADWIRYEGSFVCGRMEGFGEMWYNDGKRYKGQFKNDMPHGRGRLFNKSEEIKTGIWERGNFLTEL